jgi:cell shape-determining protein MreC
MKRTFWDDLLDLGIGVAALAGVVAIAKTLSNHQQGITSPRQYTLADLRAETQAGFNLHNSEIQQLRNRVQSLEKENARLRPFADFLDEKRKEAEQSNVQTPKPKLHLWR